MSSFTAKRKVKKLDAVLTSEEYATTAEPSKGTVLFLEDPSGYLVFERDFTSTFITPFKNASDQVLSDNVLTILLARETLYRAKKIEVPEMSKLSSAISKMIDRIVEYRILQDKLTSIAADTHIQNAVLNVLAKIVRYALPNTSTQAQDNLKELLAHIILKVLSRESIKTSVSSEVVYEQLPRQLFLGDQLKVSSGENCELQIDSIQKLFLFLAELKVRISQMSGVKYSPESNKKRGATDTRYASADWKKVQESFYSVIDNQCKSFVEKLLYRRQKSVAESVEIITLGNGKRVFVCEMIGELLIQMRDTFEPAYTHGYVLLTKTLLQNTTYPETNGPIMVAHMNHLVNLERKMRISLDAVKATLLERIVQTVPENVPKGKTAIEKEVERILAQLNVVVEEQEEIQVQASPKNKLPQLQFNITDFLLTQVTVPENPESILMSIKNRKGNYNQAVYKALEALHNSRGPAIPLSVYKNFSTKSYVPLFIAFFTGFFIGYADTYTPRYTKDLHEATMDSLEEWYKSLTDKGTFFKAHVTFVYKMISMGLMGFNPRSGLIELTRDATEKYQDTVEQYKKPVITAFARILEPRVDYPRAPVEPCKHTVLTKEIADLQDFTDGDTPEISALQNELAECHIVTPEAIVCKYCGEKLDSIISTVETFDDYTEQALHNQISGVLQVQSAEAETEEHTIFIEKTLDSVIKYYKLRVVAQVNELDADVRSTISEREKQTSIQTIQSIISSKYSFKNMAKKMEKQTTQNVRGISLQTQILYDTIKMMVLLLIGKDTSTEPLDFQKGFVAIPSMKQIVPTSVYTLPAELNYIRTIYNFAIKLIADQVGSNYFSSDDSVVTEKNVYDMPNTFGFDVHSTRQEVEQLLAVVAKTRKAQKKTSTIKVDTTEDIYPMYLKAYTSALQKINKPSRGPLELIATGVPVLIEKESFLEQYKNSNFRIKTQMSGYLNRQIEMVQHAIQILSLFKLLSVDTTAILSGENTSVNIYNNVLTVESSTGKIHSPIKIAKAVSIFMNTGITSTRLFIIEQLFKNKLVKQHTSTVMKMFYESLGTTLLAEYNDLLKTYKNIQSDITETPMYLCPYCNFTSDRVSTIKTHIYQAHDNAYLSDTTLRSGFKIIPPRDNQCSYCDYRGANVLDHIKSEHLEIKQAQSAIEQTIHMKYLVHIDKLVKNHTLVKNGNTMYLVHEPLTTSSSLIVSPAELDNYVNQHLLYREYCDSHIGSAHSYNVENGLCIFCNRSAETVEEDSKNFTTSRVAIHAKNVSDFVRKVVKTHSINSVSNKLRDDHTLSTKATLEDLTNSIDTLRQLTDVSYETCKHIIMRVQQYREDVRRMYSSYNNNQTPFDMLTIAEVDHINDNFTVSTVPVVLYDPDYIKQTKLQFPNLTDSLLNKIFSASELETMAKASTDPNEVRDLRREMNQEFAKNAYDHFTNYTKYDNTQELADTLSTITGEPASVIKRNIKAIKGQKEIPRKIIKQLTLLVAGKKDSYRDRAYLI
jgi:hypothetical protein